MGMAYMAWMGLAFIGERAWSACRVLLTTREEHSDDKAALLVFISTKLGYPVRQGPIAELIPEGSPVWTLAEWLALPVCALLPEWKAHWARAPEVLAWLKALREGGSWRQHVRGWLEHQLGPPFVNTVQGDSSR